MYAAEQYPPILEEKSRNNYKFYFHNAFEDNKYYMF